MHISPSSPIPCILAQHQMSFYILTVSRDNPPRTLQLDSRYLVQDQRVFVCNVTPELSLVHVNAPFLVFPVTPHVLFSSPSVPIPNRSCTQIPFFPSDSSNSSYSSYRNRPHRLPSSFPSLSP